MADMREPVVKRRHWTLPLTIVLGLGVPVLGTLYLGKAFPGWVWSALPFHSSVEVIGAAFGLVLATVILFSRQKEVTLSRMWVACALIAMSVLDIVHSCVPTGVSFVWLHSTAVLAGGVFFVLVWLPEREISRRAALGVPGGVLVLSTLVGVLSALFPHLLPAMVVEGRFTTTADVINFVGGGLTILAAAKFAIRFGRGRGLEDLLFLTLCLLFGGAGVIFRLSDIWEAGWWFWHLLRLSGYILALWLGLFAYRASEDRLVESRVRHAIAIAGGDYTVDVRPRHAGDRLGLALQSMVRALVKSRDEDQRQGWLQTGIARLNEAVRGDPDLVELSGKVIAEVSTYLGAQVGAFYVRDAGRGGGEEFGPLGPASLRSAGADVLRLTGSYAFKKRKNLSDTFRVGEGLVGQAALEKQRILLGKVPAGYMRVTSTLVEGAPRFVCAAPFLYEDRVLGVMEIASLKEITDLDLQYLDQALSTVAVAVQTALSRTELAAALKASQALSEKLQLQQEALKAANEELEERTEALQQSEGRLKGQQEELRQANEELEEKTESLEKQSAQVRLKNSQLEETGEALRQQAEDLATANKYKSEFLANMSHELRTPLNSLLVLAHHLEENKDGNLTDDQLESIHVIAGSGESLLALINDILDLSKIEAGKMTLQVRDVPLEDIATATRAHFSHIAKEKGLTLEVSVDDALPEAIRTDAQRLQQVIRNLVANAIKFTHEGCVRVAFARPASLPVSLPGDVSADRAIVMSVSDTGIGIPRGRRDAIFEAFQQVDGSTSRRYGGTGLGLSITRELSRLLGGRVVVESEEGRGSTFSVYLPEELDPTLPRDSAASDIRPASTSRVSGDEEVSATTPPPAALPAPCSIPDDRAGVSEGDKLVLVIEDDQNFAKVLAMTARRKHFKFLHAGDGATGVTMAREYRPSAIVLDIRMPGMDGWEVLEKLKEDVRTRHIPVHVMSVEEEPDHAIQKGIIGYLTKPVSPEGLEQAFGRIQTAMAAGLKELLVVEDDRHLQTAIAKLLGGGDTRVTAAGSIREVLDHLREQTFGCMILDLKLPDGSGLELLKRIAEDGDISVPPVVVYTGQEITAEQDEQLREYTDSIIIKGPLAEERLVDETSLFLHQVVQDMPKRKREMILRLHGGDAHFEGRKVLIADDDMRNLFALSKVLESKGIIVRKASDGVKALTLLSKEPDIDLVLMDVMMPNMDGYEAMRRIRDPESEVKNHDVPIIALTAKAMKEDRGKCIEAGANDYLAKPVNAEKLLSLMRVWLAR